MSDALQFTALRNIRPQVWEEQRQGGVINVAVSQTMDRRIEALHALRPLLVKALERAGDTHTAEDIVDGVVKGMFQFWGNEQAAIVTEIVTYPRCRVINYFLALGDLSRVLALQPEIDEFARVRGCTSAVLCGRLGWEKILPADGWHKFGVVMTKDLV